MMESVLPPLVCPRCRAGLAKGAHAYRCASCETTYPVVLGIPDLRLEPDPWIGLEQDRAKALRLHEITARMSFEEAVRAYWQITPQTPQPLVRRFSEYALGSGARARAWLDWLAAAEPPAPPGAWLEIGCGTGDLIAACASQGIPIVGVDVALRWLVIARRRPELAEGGASLALVCCNGEHLPFPDTSFVRLLSVGTLEHCRDADRVVREGRRVLLAGGVMRVKTVNRFTLLAEPHVGLWGVGLMPRRWADAYVRWRTGKRQRYLHHRPLSPRELSRGLRRAGFARVDVAAAPLLHVDRQRLARPVRWAAPVYEWLRRAPVVRHGLGWVAPLLEGRGVAA